MRSRGGKQRRGLAKNVWAGRETSGVGSVGAGGGPALLAWKMGGGRTTVLRLLLLYCTGCVNSGVRCGMQWCISRRLHLFGWCESYHQRRVPDGRRYL